MRLYHYRSIKNALLEIENETFHFSAREELNDPLEGFVRLYWKGDKAAWEGLLKNYICSVYEALDIYLLMGSENLIRHRSLIKDIHDYDHAPLGKIREELGKRFLADSDIQDLAEVFGNNKLKISEQEMRFILNSVHSKALRFCMESMLEKKGIPEEEAKQWIEVLGKTNVSLGAQLKSVKELSSYEKERLLSLKIGENMLTDMLELVFVEHGFKNEAFLYGKGFGESENIEKNNSAQNTRQHRKWLSVAIDFPKLYVEQMKNMILSLSAMEEN